MDAQRHDDRSTPLLRCEEGRPVTRVLYSGGTAGRVPGRRRWLWPSLSLLLALSCAPPGSPTRLTPADVRPGVHGRLYRPPGGGSHPAVILLHGAGGIRPKQHAYAESLAAHGYVTLVLDYYAETGPAPAGSDRRLKLWPAWQETVRNAVTYLQKMRGVRPNHIGLVGFSRGAFLAVGTAGSLPAVKAVVAYYGGGGGGRTSLEDDARDLPPTLILHGDADRVVPVSFAYALHEALAARGRPVEIQIYPGARHGFDIDQDPERYDVRATEDARRRTLAFLERQLGP